MALNYGFKLRKELYKQLCQLKECKSYERKKVQQLYDTTELDFIVENKDIVFFIRCVRTNSRPNILDYNAMVEAVEKCCKDKGIEKHQIIMVSRQKPTKNFIEHWKGENQKALFAYKPIEYIVKLVPDYINQVLGTPNPAEQEIPAKENPKSEQA
jgi:hypothetical protein